MIYHLYRNKFAFPLNEYPKMPNGKYKNLQITDVIYSKEDNQPYWDSIHEVVLLNSHKFVDLMDSVRVDPTVRTIY
jgi:hypothetical protein